MTGDPAQHLTTTRTQPSSLKPGWTPYPSYVARFQPHVNRVAMAYLGAQYPGDGPPPEPVRAALTDLAAACATPDGPSHTDRASYLDERGYTTLVTIAYWDDMTRYDSWFTTARERWLGDHHMSCEAIFGAAMRHLSTLGSAARLRLYHEVTVAAAEEQHFEYLGCHPDTGLLAVARTAT
ncbi:phenylacetaldoxime dehydratase family protein [Saccharopolyspora sp. NPDC002376]